MTAGFTLIELLVVIAMMAILLVMAVSALSSKKGAEVGQAGGLLTDLAHLARQNAVSKNTRTVLLVTQVTDAGQDRSAASIWDAGTTNQLEKWNLLPESVIATNSGDPQVPFTASNVKFRGSVVTDSTAYWFYPDGRMGDALSKAPTLQVEPRKGSTNNFYELVFNPVVGTVKVNRPDLP